MACVAETCFFFQAEDGIRDYKVTGVQTCALPISKVPKSWITPFLQRVAWKNSSPAVLVPPTTSPASLSHHTRPKSPPRVPKSVKTPCSQKNGWRMESPGSVDAPAT